MSWREAVQQNLERLSDGSGVVNECQAYGSADCTARTMSTVLLYWTASVAGLDVTHPAHLATGRILSMAYDDIERTIGVVSREALFDAKNPDPGLTSTSSSATKRS